MRIAHILLSLDPDYGGPAQSAPSLAAAQAALGHEVQLLFYESAHKCNLIESAIARIPGLDRVTFTPVALPTNLEKILVHRTRAALVAKLHGSQFVHIHDMWQPLLFHAAAVANDMRVPYAISPRGALNTWSLAQKSIKKWLALQFAWNRTLKKAAFIHALNADERRQIQRLYPSARIVTAPNGIFTEQLSRLPPPGIFRERYPELESHPFILFMSRLHKKKGLDILIPAFREVNSEFPDIHLVIAGPDEGASAETARLINDYALGSRAHIIGALDGLMKLGALRDATLFCLPSRDEGFSMAIIEAMTVGLPVVVSEQCNFPELKDTQAGIVCQLNSAAFACQITHLLRDPALRDLMAKNASNLVKNHYTWQMVANQLIRGYMRGDGPSSTNEEV